MLAHGLRFSLSALLLNFSDFLVQRLCLFPVIIDIGLQVGREQLSRLVRNLHVFLDGLNW